MHVRKLLSQALSLRLCMVLAARCASLGCCCAASSAASFLNGLFCCIELFLQMSLLRVSLLLQLLELGLVLLLHRGQQVSETRQLALMLLH